MYKSFLLLLRINISGFYFNTFLLSKVLRLFRMFCYFPYMLICKNLSCSCYVSTEQSLNFTPFFYQQPRNLSECIIRFPYIFRCTNPYRSCDLFTEKKTTLTHLIFSKICDSFHLSLIPITTQIIAIVVYVKQQSANKLSLFLSQFFVLI